MSPEIAYLPAAAIAVAGAVLDVRTRRIPNWLVLALAVAAAVGTWAAFGLADLGSAAIHALIALVVGMALFAVRFIGGGDAKFYSAAALGIPLDGALAMLGYVALVGLVAALVMIVSHRGLKIVSEGKTESWTLPYGLPICCGFLLQAFAVHRFF